MRDEKNNRSSNPGRDETRWEGSNRDPQDSKYTGQSYRTDDYNRMGNRQNAGSNSDSYSSDVNHGYNQGYNQSSHNYESPYDRASYGRDMSSNFSGSSSRDQGNRDNESEWNQRGRQTGFGNANQRDQSYGQQYSQPYSGSQSNFTGSERSSYGNSSSGNYQPRGADQGSYGQDAGANSRFQGGYPYGYDRNSEFETRNYNRDSQGSSQGMSQGYRNQEYRQDSRQGSMNQGTMNQGYGSQGSNSQGSNSQGYNSQSASGWDTQNQNYRGNDAQQSIYGAAGFGSLGVGSESMKSRSYTPDSMMSRSDYHPSSSSSSSSSMGSNYGYSSGSDSYNSNLGKQTPASYYGKGPKSFKRSDDRIREELSEMFTRHHDVDASDIEIEVKEGEVTLSGYVPERRMKYLAEDLAEKSMGVKDVTNNLRVRRDESTYSSSSDMQSSLNSSESERSEKKMNLTGSSSTAKKDTTLNPKH